MTLLRSREIVSPKTLTALSSSTPESMPPPSLSRCPSPNQELSRSGYYAGPPCRRSLRLASKSDPGKVPVSLFGGRRSGGSDDMIGACVMEEDLDGNALVDEADGEMCFDLIGKRVKGPEVMDSGIGTRGTDSDEDYAIANDSEEDVAIAHDSDDAVVNDSDEDDAIANEGRRNKKMKLDSDVTEGDLWGLEEDPAQKFLSLRSGKRVVKRGEGNVSGGGGRVGLDGEFDRILIPKEEEQVIESEMEDLSPSVHWDSGSDKLRRLFSREEKAKGKLVIDDIIPKGVDGLHLDLDKSIVGAMQVDSTQENLNDDSNADSNKAVYARLSRKEKGKAKLEEDADTMDDSNADSNIAVYARLSREEKGKAKIEEDADTKDAFEISGGYPVSHDVQMDLEEDLQLIEKAAEKVIAEANKESRVRENRERFRNVARRNASRFAHFNAEEENHSPAEAAGASASNEMEPEPAVEDWPGPFSTAMNIIRDRARKMTIQKLKSSSVKNKQPSLTWVPKTSKVCGHKLVPPSLKEMCLGVLADNADAIASLEYVPDPLRHRLSHMLCGSRKMTGDLFSLFLRGSPTEVRVRDCSWLTEEQFSKSYEKCDTSNLTVLQLDQCGRCMPDYILHSTIARLPCSLPALTTLSLSGACRLSDTGLAGLVSSAPALRSINLNQCSLLTSAGINILSEKLGSILHELYINDCQSIDAMLILPSLKRIEHLEVLSLASIETVCDEFVKEFVTSLGYNMKQLVLTNCMKLTDSSMKVIAANCPGLCTLDLVGLSKLTDSTMGYLTNGCRAIQTLKLGRNKFSDEAIAAFVESSGEVLKELSLNSVKEVGQHTAFALSRRSRNLLSLDLSWCRKMTDEDMGLVVDSCLSLKLLKVFGCTQITNVFLEGHSNPEVQIVGLKMSPFLEEIKLPCSEEGQLLNSLVSSSI